jgi:hypothetical protein
MTGSEMIAHLRESILDDTAPPFLWSTIELLRFLNYAEVQACRRAHLLIDDTTANDNGTAATAGTAGQRPLCQLTIIAGTANYLLSPKILQVRRCQLRSMASPLIGPVVYSELDEYIPGWRGTGGLIGTAGSTGHPSCYLNEPGNSVIFIQCPSVNDIADLIVSRIPLTPFTLQTSPEIVEKYHFGLMDWAAHLAYMKPDSETINLNMAKVYDDKFTAQFGSLPDAYSEKMRRTVIQNQRMRPRPFGS